MKILFFGSDNCANCRRLLREIKQAGIHKLASAFMYIDAFDDNKQDICDAHDVDNLPHLKIFADRELVYESKGAWNMKDIKKACGREGPLRKFNLSKKKDADLSSS